MNKDNIVYLDLNIYNELIMNNKILKEENSKLRKESKIYEDYFYNKILENHDYEIKNIEKFSLDEYYVRHIIRDIFEYGNIDINYIIEKIKEYKSRKESDSNES